jgi:sugar/nucleoside kinase (ribokinase family)
MSRRRQIASEAAGPTITAGEILVEIMATDPGLGFLEPLTLVGPFPSGAPAIFIDQVARLDGGAGLIGCVGRDDFGTINLERLRRDGVDVSAVSVSDRYPTGSAFVRYRPDGGRDFVYNIAESAAGQIRLTDAARALADRAGHLHVMGSTLSVAGL